MSETLVNNQRTYWRNKKLMNKSLYACAEHIETVLDMYIDDHETPPEFRKIEHTHSLSTACELCDEPAIYIVGNE